MRTIISHVLGLPRIGGKRELKHALDQYWRGEIDQTALRKVGASIRSENRSLQHDKGLSLITIGDFAWYDQMLQMSAMLGATPSRFGLAADAEASLDDLFRMARGRAPTGAPAPASEMTKWFDTNYHYLVPEITPSTSFRLASGELFDQVDEALADSRTSDKTLKVALIGPLTYLHLSKVRDGAQDRFAQLEQLTDVYCQIIARLKEQGVDWVQLDEPILSLDLEPRIRQLFAPVYKRFSEAGIKLMMANYFGGFGDNLSTALALPVDALHIDAIRGKEEIDQVVTGLPKRMTLSCGLVEGRNIWRNDLAASLATLRRLHATLGDRLMVASACSLLHSPVDLESESGLDAELKTWLAFAVQKCEEVGLLAKALNEGDAAIAEALAASNAAVAGRNQSSRIHNQQVADRVAAISPEMQRRSSPYAERAKAQAAELDLPLFPTTTIGSFPQTADIRRVRRQFKEGKIGESDYLETMRAEIRDAIRRQEDIGLDVLVHGEPERNDMVEYFGEQLDGFAFTANGWVQSYGSRCVKPPIIFGDVSRPRPMTVEWSRYAQSLSRRKVKGMLTGAITILCWSFERDDLPRKDICTQIALALRDEVLDLEKAGIRIIQIDEPAIREGMPLRKADTEAYFDWAVASFHLTADGVADDTQIHTHMCYSEFNEMIDSVAALDADVISIEASRSNLELLEAFERFNYPNEIGPGVYDIHSPNVPDTDWIVRVMRKASQRIPRERLWINPDCGLKTRAWEETTASLKAMVKAAEILRADVAAAA